MASSLMGIIPGKHQVTINEMMMEAGRQGAANTASNQQVIIPRKHQVIIDEMITAVAGDVDMLNKNAGKQGLLNDMSKVEAGQQGVIVNDMPKKRECNTTTQVHGIATVSNLTLGDLPLVRGDEFAPGTQVHGIATVSNLTLGDLPLVRGDEFAPGTIREGYVSCKTRNSKGNVIYDMLKKKQERNTTQVHGIATVRNLTRGGLRLVRGDEFARGTIREGRDVSFVTKNSKGYVIYDGTNVQGGPHNCAWLLAWCVHSDGYGNQVYVECGARRNIIAMPDYQIYKNMDASDSLSTYVDPKTNTDASARIQAICTTPKLGCVFDLGGNRS